MKHLAVFVMLTVGSICGYGNHFTLQ